MPLLLPTKPTAAATVVLLTAMIISTRDRSTQVTAFAPTFSFSSSVVHSCYSRISSCRTLVEGGIHNRQFQKFHEMRPLGSSATSSDTEGSTATEKEESAPKKKKFVKPQRRRKNNLANDNSSSDSHDKKSDANKPKNNKKKKIVVTHNNNNNTSSNNNNNNNNPKSFKPLKDLKLGSKISGKIIDVCDFGAFVHIGYATRGSRPGAALLHISQIADDRIQNIHDVLRKGDTVRDARVITVDSTKGEVGLSLRNPRHKRRDLRTVKTGEALEGKVDKIVPYGAFVDVGASVNPLLHISRITGGAIENIRHHLNEGDPVTVHVIGLDLEKKTMAVSMLDRKADLYLDRRMSQKMKRFYGGAKGSGDRESDDDEDHYDDEEEEDDPSELDYFDQAIRELEEALRDRK